jgi:hypothetical protein
MTVASNGDAFISDGHSGDVYVVKHDRDDLEPLAPAGVFVSPQTPTLDESETLLYVPDYAEGIALVHLSDKHIDWVKSSAPMAFDGIDGLYWTKAGLIATQNGTSPERIVRFVLRQPANITAFITIEANWPGLGDPTHGVVIGDWFYFIANSGWNRVSEDEKSFQSGAPAEVWRVRLSHLGMTTPATR